jgi:hypothetical protein
MFGAQSVVTLRLASVRKDVTPDYEEDQEGTQYAHTIRLSFERSP